MESIFSKLQGIQNSIEEINKRLDAIETKLAELENKPLTIQQDVAIQTALKGLLNATRKL